MIKRVVAYGCSHAYGTEMSGRHDDTGSREFVFGNRDRVDEVFDCSRSVRNKRWLYIRNNASSIHCCRHPIHAGFLSVPGLDPGEYQNSVPYPQNILTSLVDPLMDLA